MHVHIFAYVVDKYYAAPYVLTSEKACHLWDQTWLCGHYLVHRDSIARIFVLRPANGSTLISYGQGLAVRLPKLSGDTQMEVSFGK